QGRVWAHGRVMLAAVAAATLFLPTYLVYDARVGSVGFPGEGALRVAYFAIRLTRTLLAATIVPLVALTLARGLRGSFDRHRRIARLTLPLWAYVSVTGVVIYWMLYRM